MSVQTLGSHGIEGLSGRGQMLLSESTVMPAASPVSGSGFHPASARPQDNFSDTGVVSRVLAGIDTVGSLPAVVSVYSQPMGRSIVTDVVVHQTDLNDGSKKVDNHWQGATLPPPETPVQDGISVSGLRVGAYEESRMAAREAYMMFQGMKVNQTV